MTVLRTKLSQTQETPAWKVSLTRIDGIQGKPKEESLLGWEYASPQKGYPYLVYLKKNGVLQTSLVQEIRKTDDGVIIRTRNSAYHIEYLSTGYFTDDLTK